MGDGAREDEDEDEDEDEGDLDLELKGDLDLGLEDLEEAAAGGEEGAAVEGDGGATVGVGDVGAAGDVGNITDANTNAWCRSDEAEVEGLEVDTFIGRVGFLVSDMMVDVLGSEASKCEIQNGFTTDESPFYTRFKWWE